MTTTPIRIVVGDQTIDARLWDDIRATRVATSDHLCLLLITHDH